jgi:hypothetical protein
METRSAGLQRKPGVCYIAGPDGRDWPVIDVTHPAFAVHPGEDELRALTAAYLGDEERRAKMPPWLQRLFFRVFLRKSVLARGLREAAGGFLPGLSTYRMKLGPDNLDPSSTHAIDRRIAASLPSLSMRLRLQDMAAFLADDLVTKLASAPAKTLHLVNIAGGPSMDSVNALILLQRRDTHLLRGRSVRVHVLDHDTAGPEFGARALEALRATGAALADVDATMTHVPYRWDDAASLRVYLRGEVPADAVVAVSSEGGLFDYGSDEEIVANLEALRAYLSSGAIMAGSVSRADHPAAHLRRGMRFTTRPRRLEDFAALVNGAGWDLERNATRPFNFSVALRSRGVAEIPRA